MLWFPVDLHLNLLVISVKILGVFFRNSSCFFGVVFFCRFCFEDILHWSLWTYKRSLRFALCWDVLCRRTWSICQFCFITFQYLAYFFFFLNFISDVSWAFLEVWQFVNTQLQQSLNNLKVPGFLFSFYLVGLIRLFCYPLCVFIYNSTLFLGLCVLPSAFPFPSCTHHIFSKMWGGSHGSLHIFSHSGNRLQHGIGLFLHICQTSSSFSYVFLVPK